MINKITSFNSQNNLSFGNAKYASRGFRQFTQDAVQLFDSGTLFESAKNGAVIKKDVYHNADGSQRYSMHVHKIFEDAVNMAVSVSQTKSRRSKNIYDFILATFGEKDSYICLYSYNKKTGKISDNARSQPITAEKNEFFEKYVSRLLKPFIDK